MVMRMASPSFLRFEMSATLTIFYCALAALNLAILALLRSTGNFGRLFAPFLWLAVDLLVTVAGIFCAESPAYPVIWLRMVAMDATVFLFCLGWTGLDVIRGDHPLSLRFFFGLLAMGVTEALQVFLVYHSRISIAVLAYASVGICAGVTLYLIASLFLPIPPDAVVNNPRTSLQAPLTAPMLARIAR